MDKEKVMRRRESGAGGWAQRGELRGCFQGKCVKTVMCSFVYRFFSLLGVARACRRIGGKEGLEELGEAWMAGMGVEIALRKIVTGG